MTNYVDGKVIIVTGAASGFGKVLSLKAAQLGGHIVCADINGDTLQTAVEEIETAGGSALAVQTDVTDADSMRSLVARGVAQYGQIDVLVNNAGIMPLAFFSDHEQASEAWNRCIDINFNGTQRYRPPKNWNCSRYVFCIRRNWWFWRAVYNWIA